VLPTAYTRTHLTRQQQQQVTAFAFSIIVMAEFWRSSSPIFWIVLRPFGRRQPRWREAGSPHCGL